GPGSQRGRGGRGAGTTGAPSWRRAGPQHRRSHAPGDAPGDPQAGREPAAAPGLRGADLAGERARRSGQHHPAADPLRATDVLARRAEVVSRLVAEGAAPGRRREAFGYAGMACGAACWARSSACSAARRTLWGSASLPSDSATPTLIVTDTACLAEAGRAGFPGRLGSGVATSRVEASTARRTASRCWAAAGCAMRRNTTAKVWSPEKEARPPSSHFGERGGGEPQHAAGGVGAVGLPETGEVVDFDPRERV